MDWMKVLEYVASILAGLAAAIPLAIQLIKYVKASVKEKNWTKLFNLVIDLMKQAETKFDTGADRREWCLMMIKASADTIDYDIDLEAIGKMIDDLCAMSNIVNSPEAKAGE